MAHWEQLEKALNQRHIRIPKMRMLSRLSYAVVVIFTVSVLLFCTNIVVLHKIWVEQMQLREGPIKRQLPSPLRTAIVPSKSQPLSQHRKLNKDDVDSNTDNSDTNSNSNSNSNINTNINSNSNINRNNNNGHHHISRRNHSRVESRRFTSSNSAPHLWVYAKKPNNGYLKHVFSVFESLGYDTRGDENNWDVLWSHEYPFEELSHVIRKLKPNQKVNHFPGSGYITSKVSLAMSHFSFVPKAFKLPDKIDAYRDYITQHPNKLWVQKSNNHRGVKIRRPHELDLSKDGTFVQEYIANPLLIDGHKFDIGVYAVLTSIKPLRVYILESEALFRFCPLKYYPFDPSIVQKYVVSDVYIPLWEMPTFHKLYKERGYTFRESFNYFLKTKGLNPVLFWDKIKTAIASVYLDKEKKLIHSSRLYKSSRNFFELVRFDFVLDDNFNIFLMEANMSPNLSSLTHPENSRLYEHVVYNLLSVVGLATGTALQFPNIVLDSDSKEVSDADINVFSDRCMADTCRSSNCTIWQCRLCNYCMTTNEKVMVKMAFLEHVNRGNTRRIVPPYAETSEELAILTSSVTRGMNYENKFLTLWFLGQCQKDITWCN